VCAERERGEKLKQTGAFGRRAQSPHPKIMT